MTNSKKIFLLTIILFSFAIFESTYAQKSTKLYLSGFMPVKCSVSMDISTNKSAGLIGQINQDCNTKHLINLRYDPSKIPNNQNISVIYAGNNVVLNKSGVVTIDREGPFRNKRNLVINNNSSSDISQLLQSFKVSYQTI